MLEDPDDPDAEQMQLQLEVPSITMSFINSGSEVFTSTLIKLGAFILAKPDEVIYEMTVDRMQVDNQS